jgi:hypothetical protein
MFIKHFFGPPATSFLFFPQVTTVPSGSRSPDYRVSTTTLKTHDTRKDSSGWVISPSQISLASQHTTLTRHKHPCPRYSNLQSQLASDHRTRAVTGIGTSSLLGLNIFLCVQLSNTLPHPEKYVLHLTWLSFTSTWKEKKAALRTYKYWCFLDSIKEGKNVGVFKCV